MTNAGSADNGFVFFLKLGGDTTMDDILAMFEDAVHHREHVGRDCPVFSAVGGLMTNSVSDDLLDDARSGAGQLRRHQQHRRYELPVQRIWPRHFTVK